MAALRNNALFFFNSRCCHVAQNSKGQGSAGAGPPTRISSHWVPLVSPPPRGLLTNGIARARAHSSSPSDGSGSVCAGQEHVFCGQSPSSIPFASPRATVCVCVCACPAPVSTARGLAPGWSFSQGDQAREDHGGCWSQGRFPGPRPEPGSGQGEPDALRWLWASPVPSCSCSGTRPRCLYSQGISRDPGMCSAETELVFWLIGIRGDPCAGRALSWGAERTGKELWLWFFPVSRSAPRGLRAWHTASSYHRCVTGCRLRHSFPLLPPQSCTNNNH